MMAMDETAGVNQPIYESLRRRFTHLRANGQHGRAMDDFEAFLKKPGTLTSPSLILRCRFMRGSADYRIVVDKPKSHWRLSTQFLPFLDRVKDRFRGQADVFVLVSDTMYVAEEWRSDCVEFMRRAPFLRCDWRDDDPVSSHALPIPDFTLMDADYASDIAQIDAAVTEIPFSERRPVIKWRGRLTGPAFPDMENRHLFPRYHLLTLAASRPDIFDARLTHPDNFATTPSGSALLKHVEDHLGGTGPEMKPSEFVAYKYLISMDGVVATWKRVANSLHTGSVVFLPIHWKQFFYPGLVAGEHYVAIKADLSDLFERRAWLEAHPDDAERIGIQGRRFAREAISVQALEDFFVAVIAGCSQLGESGHPGSAHTTRSEGALNDG